MHATKESDTMHRIKDANDFYHLRKMYHIELKQQTKM